MQIEKIVKILPLSRVSPGEAKYAERRLSNVLRSLTSILFSVGADDGTWQRFRNESSCCVRFHGAARRGAQLESHLPQQQHRGLVHRPAYCSKTHKPGRQGTPGQCGLCPTAAGRCVGVQGRREFEVLPQRSAILEASRMCAVAFGTGFREEQNL